MISYTVGYGPKYAGRFIRMRVTSAANPLRRAGACPPPPARQRDTEWLAGTLFVLLQALILGLAIVTTA